MHLLNPQNVPTLLILTTTKVFNGFGGYVLKHIFVVANLLQEWAFHFPKCPPSFFFLFFLSQEKKSHRCLNKVARLNIDPKISSHPKAKLTVHLFEKHHTHCTLPYILDSKNFI
jgi:hypothetical protein